MSVQDSRSVLALRDDRRFAEELGLVEDREPSVAVRKSETVAFRYPVMPIADGFGRGFLAMMGASWDSGARATGAHRRWLAQNG